MHYLYVGYYVEEDTFTEIVKRKINNMSVARQKFEFNLIRGLHEQLGNDISFISYVPKDKNMVIPKCSEVQGATVYHIAIQKKSAESIFSAYNEFRKYLFNLGEKKLKDLRVLMYAVILPFEQALLSLKQKYSFKLVTVCSEVPKLRRYGKSLSSQIKKRLLTYYNEQFDGYVLFSEAMKEVLKIENKPYLVMEGIAPDIRNTPVTGKRNIVMYAGGLAFDNNIPFLIECCKRIDELDEIWICGVGPDEEKVKQLAEKDFRVKYYGRVPNKVVLEMEAKAKILVNFRNPKEKLTRYSFPSKILEYIASGSVVISTRLVGIPKEYFEYIIPVDIEDSNHIIKVLKEVLTLDDEEYLRKCKIAANYIFENKNVHVQTTKIINLLNDIR